MKIYTSNASENKLEHMKRLDVGCLICSLPSSSIVKGLSKVDCAIDNGAFTAYKRGFPFMSEYFLKTLDQAYKKSIKLGWIVCPDIVAGGNKSLDFSMRWANSETLETSNNLYLPVQDGMSAKRIGEVIGRFSGLFVGGTTEWKWENAEWINDMAHDNGMKCHIGRCGTLEGLKAAHKIGVDSVDSSSFVRNDSWHIIEAFHRWVSHGDDQTDMFND